MNKSNVEIVNGIEVDIDKVNRLLMKLIIKEKGNIRTKKLNNQAMVILIKKMIEEEVGCY